jgi:hypothetical protein
MTKKQWLKSADPRAMLEFLGKRASDRKLRLFACACCRRMWDFAKDERLHTLFSLVEGFADGAVKDRERAQRIGRAVLAATDADPQGCLASELCGVARKKLNRTDCEFGVYAAAAYGWAKRGNSARRFDTAKQAERKQQTRVVREVFGYPPRPVPFDPVWRTSDVMLLANGTYTERAFDRMPILADALQDAGCDCDDLLTHLRDTRATHVRGCWALDLVLGKS